MIASRSPKQQEIQITSQKKAIAACDKEAIRVNLYSYLMIVTRSGNKNQAITLIATAMPGMTPILTKKPQRLTIAVVLYFLKIRTLLQCIASIAKNYTHSEALTHAQSVGMLTAIVATLPIGNLFYVTAISILTPITPIGIT